MKKFRVRLFPEKSGKPKGLMGAIKNIIGGGKPKFKQGDKLDFEIGRVVEDDYNYVNVFFQGELVGEIRKGGIDELIEKGAIVSLTYAGYINDVPQILLQRLETDEYRETPEYKIWREKLDKRLAAEREEREKNFLTEVNQWIKVLSTKTVPLERHFKFQGIVAETYKRRKDPEMRKICKNIGIKHVSEFKNIVPALKKEFKGTLPIVVTFQYLATLFTEDGDFDQAIKACKIAINYGLKDGTKGGYEGRIKKIENKKKKA